MSNITFSQQAGSLDYAFGNAGISIVDNNGYDDAGVYAIFL